MRKEGYGFPEMLAAALRICDVTQTELARRCGISEAFLIALAARERERSRPDAKGR